MKLTDEQVTEARRLYYEDGRNLRQVADAVRCSIYDLSPWLYMEDPALPAAFALARAKVWAEDFTALVLGVDGRVHLGNFQLKMGGRLMESACRTPPMRPIGPRETWWFFTPWRYCPACDGRLTGEER